MICKEMRISERAVLSAYISDPEIGYGVKKKWPAMVIVPGGGYLISATKEGEGAAVPFIAQGFHCFVLRYSTYFLDRESFAAGKPNLDENAHYPVQELELMTALHLIRQHAEEWYIDEEHIFLNGYSAGAHIATTVALRGNDPVLTKRLPFEVRRDEFRVRGLVLGYPMLSGNMADYMYSKRNEPGNIYDQMPYMSRALFGTEHPTEEQKREADLIRFITDDAPAFFIWQTGKDVVLDPAEVSRFVTELQMHHVPCEYHLFLNGPHGLCMAGGPYAKDESEADGDIAMWFPLACNWLKNMR